MLDYSIGYYFLHYYPTTLDWSSFKIPLLTQTHSLPLLNSRKENSIQKSHINKNFRSISQQLYTVRIFISGGNPTEISYTQLLCIKYWFEIKGNKKYSLIGDCTYSLLKNLNLNKS